ncbi:hypothetical protein T02_780 [Trichinella nativa]|uniref:Uncharacterized protein n=1 Tax=Trichinella nativa TaxID=6335 RepID=A0A0V1LK63_9BILA|nr:hypothetical protein T02_780 [Trichinella nativa]
MAIVYTILWSGMGPGFQSMWWKCGVQVYNNEVQLQWKYGEQVYNPELVLEGCGEFIPLLGRNGSSGKYVHY